MENRYGYLVKRFIACMSDLYIAGVLSALIGSFINQVLYGKLDVNFFQNPDKTPIVIISMGISYLILFIIIPLSRKKHQTLMQKFLKLELVTIDEQKVDVKTTILRFIIGCLLIEGYLYPLVTTVYAFISKKLFNDFSFSNGLSYILIIVAISSMFAAIRDKQHNRMFHDYIFKTKVIEERK